MAGVLAGFGEELRSERERRGISLEKMCAETKVNSRHFAALERGDYKALPGGVFRRGIVRAYLGSLGLEERDWMPRFEKSYSSFAKDSGETAASEEAWATFAANVKKNRGPARRRNTGRWLGVLALLLLLLAGGWAVWHFVLQPRGIRLLTANLAAAGCGTPGCYTSGEYPILNLEGSNGHR